MNTFGLKDRDVNTLLSVFAKYPEIKVVHLYGSRAKGNFKTGSDIDIAIMNKGINEKTLWNLKFDLEEGSLPYRVDITNYPALTYPDLKEHIERVGILIYPV
ncbi:MAG: hypothetical protein A3H98_02195 [Bacteroidetes bacterium RIFCSPLOWO2_02_FULL_36_8]|nr:MAG: hypothetical protein A3H98_02195 [Bacteroidetes bacterium RIFCSPLOWO2_02_FULL_36_8]OFY69198.1 MAG: hypothetical protein A3G23_06525 [Bacteroidetes bacterium RIFCSPLOWO2_12_FULL_37_12]